MATFLEDKRLNLSPIDLQMDLPLNINVNDWQNKYLDISINMAKIANFQPKIGQDATFAPTLNVHNSAIFHPILMFDTTKMISSSRRIEWC